MNSPKILIATFILVLASIITFNALQVSATEVTIDTNLFVTPHIISFETVFPGEVQYALYHS